MNDPFLPSPEQIAVGYSRKARILRDPERPSLKRLRNPVVQRDAELGARIQHQHLSGELFQNLPLRTGVCGGPVHNQSGKRACRFQGRVFKGDIQRLQELIQLSRCANHTGYCKMLLRFILHDIVVQDAGDRILLKIELQP